MILSLIIPYYNVQKYTEELLHILEYQIQNSKGVEVILVDDGSPEPFINSHKWVKVIRLDENKGPSVARNIGLNNAKGDYIAFIDADDIVSKDYIKNILSYIKKSPDYIEMSWKSLTPEGMQFNCKVTNSRPLLNPSVCTRVFKKSFIGDLRFNEDKDVGEDEEFTRKLDLSRGKRDYISSYMYFYRTTVKGSQTKLYKRGLKNTKKIIYHIPEIKADDVELLNEIKAADKKDVVFLFTYDNQMPELSKYCQISQPYRTWAHELRGEPCGLVQIIQPPFNTQVVIYINGTSGFDGITTFIHNFCRQMSKYYDITILHDFLNTSDVNRLRSIVRVARRGSYPAIYCDTLLMMRIGDNVPEEVKYKQLFQVVHCTKSDHRILKRDPDECIFVSETARASFTNKKGKVIYNLSNPDKPKKSLILMSTSRIGANDKGDQDRWMISFAELLNRQHVPFLWFYFSVVPLRGAPGNLIRIDPVDDVRGFLKHADYLVHLSENEAYCYSITEALSVGVPVIAFDIPILHELGFQDEIDGYIIPKDLSIDTNIILNAPGFKGYQITDDDKAISEWRKVLGNTTPRNDYIPERMITVKAIKTYKDIELNRTITPGEEFSVWSDRAEYLYKLRLVEMEG